MSSSRASGQAFFGISLLLFAASWAATIAWCVPGPARPRMPMCGGGTMPAAWLGMPGPIGPGPASSFLAMWVVMMAAMMLPSLVPSLRRYQSALAGTGSIGLASLTALAGLGYFCVWTACGMIVYALSAAPATAATAQPQLAAAAPIAAAFAVLAAGALQFTARKAHWLACCREQPGGGRPLGADPRTAFRHGLRLGLHCSRCCANLMAILVVTGIMDLGAMIAVTAAITLERLAPAGDRAARAVGAIVIGAGLILLAQAA